jgi:hypothetical protein
MTCERCFKPLDQGEHGQYLCPFEPRRANGVIPDDIPGGVEIAHGICNADGTPRKYYSKSEMAREAKRRELTNFVQHVGERGSDKSPHTSRWI